MFGSRQCSECGSKIATPTNEGLCPRCLMAAAMGGENPAASEFAPTMQSRKHFVPPAAESLAKSFPHLEILETLGHGGMGAVYKARQKKLDRIVALKIVRPDTADDPNFTVRFDREAKTLARLNHPNIVGVYDFGDVDYITDTGESGGVLYYFLMEYVDGINLRHLIQTGETTSRQALSIVMQMCEALQYAHNQGVVHRDIKPENILLDSHGRVKIADFGLAKLGGDMDDLHLTATRQVLGTVQYMAPEQMTHSKTVDHRADIYSMGVVFYEMLTGEIPVGAFDVPSRRAAVDARLDEVVMKALASDPDRRYQSAGDVGNQISSISSTDESGRVQDRMYVPGPSTIIDHGVAALAAGMKGLLHGPEESDEEENLGKTDVTLTREQIQADRLPDVCIVCGRKTRRRLGRNFEHTPQSAEWIIVLLLVLLFPAGIIAAVYLTKRIRVALPVCAKHNGHWSRLSWFASVGWLLIPSGVFLGLWMINYRPSGEDEVVLLVGTILGGVASYVIPLVYLATTRVGVAEITDTTLTLKRVSVSFVRAAARL